MSEIQSSVPTVQYKDIPGFPGYRAGDDGTIWSCRPLCRWGPLTSEWRLLRHSLSSCGYPQVELGSETRKRRTYPIHRLILETFVGPCPPGFLCCHHDDVKTNNRLPNLRWDTAQANRADAMRNGLYLVGSQHAASKLTESEVFEMRELAASGTSIRSLSERFGVSIQLCHGIVRGRSWKHVGGPITPSDGSWHRARGLA